MNNVIQLIISYDGNPISSVTLGKIFGISGTEIRRIVNAARCDGCPICSCHKGYYYSENAEDIEHTVQSLQNRICGIQKAINGLSVLVGGG